MGLSAQLTGTVRSDGETESDTVAPFTITDRSEGGTVSSVDRNC